MITPILLVLAAVSTSDAPVEAARSWREANSAAIVREYAEFLSIPNVSGDLPNLRRNAEVIRDGLRDRGVESRLLELNGVAPIVFGELRAPGATRTLGIYVHYDGQPVDASAWTTPPFEPSLFDAAIENGGRRIPLPEAGDAIDPEWRLYARGSGDDKAPIAAIFAALDALRARTIPMTSNLIFFFEGEEEAGSTNLREHLEQAKPLLKDVDLWLICDGPVHQSGKPQLVFGVRGITAMEITVYGAARNLHSGHYGTWAPNPAMSLSHLLASMKDESGVVLIEGFYDSTIPPNDAEREAMRALPEVGALLRDELGVVESEGGNAPYIERLLIPSLNIRGLASATVGETARNVVPNRATASIDVRLAQGNDPDAMLDLVERHIESQGYFIVRDEPTMAQRRAHAKIAKVTREGGYRAVRTRMDHPAAAPLIQAVSRATGEPALLAPTLGGSLPLYLFEDVLGAPLVIVPIANHDNNQHAPDENLRLANLWYGVDLFAAILTAK